MSEEEILKECTELAENEHHELGNCWDEEYSNSAIFGLIMLYKQTKESEEVLANKLQETNIELDKTADLLNTCNKRLESISRELGLIDEHTYGYDYEEIFNAITELKVKEKYWQDCFLEQVKYGNKITISGDTIVIKNIINTK